MYFDNYDYLPEFPEECEPCEQLISQNTTGFINWENRHEKIMTGLDLKKKWAATFGFTTKRRFNNFNRFNLALTCKLGDFLLGIDF